MGTKDVLKEKIKAEMSCPFNFECERADFAGYPDVHNSTNLLQCTSEKVSDCGFTVPYSNSFYCKCPYLNYVRDGFFSPKTT